ncbi:hypothetical protein NP493_480g02019 [Ridgeia piscesae]|uniref:Uncharacterized protein n=1 Tax=Ridgeia piscesae TaxID=27915 RepID=A0AAD9NT16_RIDPI|nr:hypothetical protein NP493_480g02019 [Ridgeia piscesae]
MIVGQNSVPYNNDTQTCTHPPVCTHTPGCTHRSNIVNQPYDNGADASHELPILLQYCSSQSAVLSCTEATTGHYPHQHRLPRPPCLLPLGHIQPSTLSTAPFPSVSLVYTLCQ